MRRREFIALMGTCRCIRSLRVRSRVTNCRSLQFLSQAHSKSGTPGLLHLFTVAELGWSEGHNTVAINVRWAEGDSDRFAEIAAEFVCLNVDVIVTASTEAVRAAKRATSTIPIVFATAGDPVGAGLVASLARPGGNVTGVSNQFTDLGGKRLNSCARSFHVFVDWEFWATIPIECNASMNAVAEFSRAAGMEVVKSEIRRAEDIVPSFAALKDQAQALYIASGPLVDSDRDRINALAVAEGLPTMHGTREQVQAGGLMSYGANRLHQYERTAELLDKNLTRYEACRIPSGAANKIRAGHQHENREGTGPDHSAQRARHRRQGDRIGAPFAGNCSRQLLADSGVRCGAKECPLLGL